MMDNSFNLESSLTHVTEHGAEVFAHDSYSEFFLARALADRIATSQMSEREAFDMLKESTQIIGSAHIDAKGVTLSCGEGHDLSAHAKKLSAIQKTLSPIRPGPCLNDPTKMAWKGKTRVIRSYKCPAQMSFIGMPISRSYFQQSLPFLIGLGYESLLGFLLAESPDPDFLAKCYVESSRDVSVEERVVDYLCSSLEGDSENFTLIHVVSSALDQVKPRDPNYVKRFFESNQRRLREIAAELVSDYDFEVVREMLEDYSKHDDWRVRWNALVALGTYDMFDSRQIIFDRLRHDPCEQVAYKAASVLSTSKESTNAPNFVLDYFQDRLARKDFDPEESQRARDEIGT